MKFFLVLISFFLFFNSNSQCLSDVTSLSIMHSAVRNNHFIPALYINYQSGTGKKEQSYRSNSDTANFITTNKKTFRNLTEYLCQDSLFSDYKSNPVSKFGEIQITFYEEKNLVFRYSIVGKENAINYLNKILNYTVSNAFGDNIVSVFEFLISDIENHR